MAVKRKKRERAIWAKLLQAQGAPLSPESAEAVLSIDFKRDERTRVERLAERSEAGRLTDEKRAEIEGYLRIGNLLAVMQSRARLALGRKPPVG